MPRLLPQALFNLLSRPATRPYPAKPRDPFPQARGELVNDIENCIFCGTCARKCPSQCIQVEKDKDAGTGVWRYDPFACVYCGICVDNCPVNCLSQKNLHRPVAPEHIQPLALTGRLKSKTKD